MYNKVVFYLHYGAGDIFESREFVKDWISKIPAEEYLYAHGKHPKILRDMLNLKSIEVTPIMDMRRDVCEIDNCLYINCWIGRDGKYVLPGIGCTVEKLYEMHNDMMTKLGVGKLSKPIIEYIPNLNFNYYDVHNINSFLERHPERKILIDNGNVQSNQAFNFDFTPIIIRLASYYKNYTFIITHPIYDNRPNIYMTNKIINSIEPFDLPEISYLSKFCDTIIGRNSGPFVYAQTLDNLMNQYKYFLSFTYKEIAGYFVLNQEIKAKRVWSDFISEDEVYYKCVEVIGK